MDDLDKPYMFDHIYELQGQGPSIILEDELVMHVPEIWNGDMAKLHLYAAVVSDRYLAIRIDNSCTHSV